MPYEVEENKLYADTHNPLANMAILLCPEYHMSITWLQLEKTAGRFGKRFCIR